MAIIEDNLGVADMLLELVEGGEDGQKQDHRRGNEKHLGDSSNYWIFFEGHNNNVLLTVRERHCESVGVGVCQEEERERRGSPQNSSILNFLFSSLFFSFCFSEIRRMK